jgi:thiosulfate/3-mercaptopyruvate sulfurtransferase
MVPPASDGSDAARVSAGPALEWRWAGAGPALERRWSGAGVALGRRWRGVGGGFVARFGPMEPFVTPEWLRDHRQEVVLADVRWYGDGREGRDGYARSHLPGARYVELEDVLSAPGDPARFGRHPMPTPERFAAGLAAAGIGAGDTVVAYDDAGGVIAARLVWMLRVTGHAAALLDGGLGGWPEKDLVSGWPEKDLVGGWPEKDLVGGWPEKDLVSGWPEKDLVSGWPEKDLVSGWPEKDLVSGSASGGAGAGDEPASGAATQGGAAQFTPVPWPAAVLVDIDTAGAAATDGSAVVIDARPADRFAGAPDALDPVAGHIPGARSVPTREHLQADGTMRTPQALRERFTQAGIEPGTEVISYCGSGVTACHNLLALEYAGLGPGRLFPGSWSQWSRDPERPVETGAERTDAET